MTKSELLLYRKMSEIKSRGYKIIPQVNLNSIIDKKSNQRYRTELYRLIDFGIFDSDFNLKLLIELNDGTHNQKKRISRDIKVKKICSAAGYKIMTFYTKYPNEKNYVVNRILEELEPIFVTPLPYTFRDCISAIFSKTSDAFSVVSLL